MTDKEFISTDCTLTRNIEGGIDFFSDELIDLVKDYEDTAASVEIDAAEYAVTAEAQDAAVQAEVDAATHWKLTKSTEFKVRFEFEQSDGRRVVKTGNVKLLDSAVKNIARNLFSNIGRLIFDAQINCDGQEVVKFISGFPGQWRFVDTDVENAFRTGVKNYAPEHAAEIHKQLIESNFQDTMKIQRWLQHTALDIDDCVLGLIADCYYIRYGHEDKVAEKLTHFPDRWLNGEAIILHTWFPAQLKLARILGRVFDFDFSTKLFEALDAWTPPDETVDNNDDDEIAEVEVAESEDDDELIDPPVSDADTKIEFDGYKFSTTHQKLDWLIVQMSHLSAELSRTLRFAERVKKDETRIRYNAEIADIKNNLTRFEREYERTTNSYKSAARVTVVFATNDEVALADIDNLMAQIDKRILKSFEYLYFECEFRETVEDYILAETGIDYDKYCFVEQYRGEFSAEDCDNISALLHSHSEKVAFNVDLEPIGATKAAVVTSLVAIEETPVVEIATADEVKAERQEKLKQAQSVIGTTIKANSADLEILSMALDEADINDEPADDLCDSYFEIIDKNKQLRKLKAKIDRELTPPPESVVTVDIDEYTEFDADFSADSPTEPKLCAKSDMDMQPFIKIIRDTEDYIFRLKSFRTLVAHHKIQIAEYKHERADYGNDALPLIYNPQLLAECITQATAAGVPP